VLARLGIIPLGGETFVFEDRRYTVVEMEGRRVSRVKIEQLHPEGLPSKEGPALPPKPSA
jgi:CBS domain containing-hemolysin-like protein